MDLLATTQILRVDAGEKLLAQLRGNPLDPLDERQRRSIQDDPFGSPILGNGLATDQPLGLQTIEQTSQGRPLDTHAPGQLALGRDLLETGQMQENQPTSLRQPQVGQAAIQLGAPGTRQESKLHRKSMLI